MILVTGSSGLLGSEIKKQLNDIPAYFPSRDELDVTDYQSINKYFKNKKIKSIINCAANVNAEYLEENEEIARKITVDAPKFLAKKSSEIGAAIIHISTDYVFDGKKNTPYKEDDKTTGLSVYGKLKIEGENKVLKYAESCAIIRTAWLFSEHGRDFIETIRRISLTRKEISVVYDQVGSPSYIPDLAAMILTVSENIKTGEKEIFHATNEGVCSWYDLANIIARKLDLNCTVTPILSESYPMKATRPHYSVLDKTKIKNRFNIKIRHYSEALEECLNKIRNK
ncbi:dTDP-4-dehydrorhamnose reductase [Yersinia enterocolitica]|uniref:dTDP-4-dehydrorhamnose reductase n=1 Tax=Yersinia enterocolitica TaxID=630 RepID=UPI001C8E7BDE|nr:dTDP-4-dehydrorhamnose reductase [Yersinia enterocolitica]MBX9477817.1 dTDP-4-dehydrorhamnose reductase [Yersinia enterocolitica]